MTIYHKHHIIPRHMGGTDDPSNLIDLTVEDHAEAHKILYEIYGDEKDRIAWLGLLGLISKSDVMLSLHKLGRQKADDVMLERYGTKYPSQLPHAREIISERLKLAHKNGLYPTPPSWVGKKHTETTKNKMRKSRNKGAKNSQYGTVWITNGKDNKKIKKDIDVFPEGWYRGRTTK